MAGKEKREIKTCLQMLKPQGPANNNAVKWNRKSKVSTLCVLTFKWKRDTEELLVIVLLDVHLN